MRFKLLSNRIGHFNLLDPEEERWSFSLAIVDDNGAIVEENGVKAKLQFDTKNFEDKYTENWADNLAMLVEEAFENANYTISSTDYLGQTILFIKTYIKNYDEIVENWEKETKENIQKKISNLEEKLESVHFLWDIDDFNMCGRQYQDRYKRWIQDNNDMIVQLVEGSKEAEKLKAENVKYLSLIDKYDIEKYMKSFLEEKVDGEN